jgi:hypothetical protein
MHVISITNAVADLQSVTTINGGCRTLDLHIWTSRCDNSDEAGGFHGDPIYQQ